MLAQALILVTWAVLTVAGIVGAALSLAGIGGLVVAIWKLRQ